MRAAIFLLQQFDRNAALAPFRSNYPSAEVSSSFFCTRRFSTDKSFQSSKHVWQLRNEPIEKSFRFGARLHVPPMLASPQKGGKFEDPNKRLGPLAQLVHILVCATTPGTLIMISLAERRRSRSLGHRDGELRMIMDVMEIQKYLPHRYPFLMVDGILEIERLKRIVGIKNVSATESHFQGHFPGQPVMPGVLIIESMAQTGGLLLLLEVPDRQNKLLFFVAVPGARVCRPVGSRELL